MFAKLSQRVAASMARSASKPASAGSKWMAAGIAGGVVAGSVALSPAFASDNPYVLSSPHYPWEHDKMLGGFDSAAIRRGYEVYRNVCASCHSLELVAFRNLVGASHTEAQAKALAQSFEVEDGPNDEGQMFQRKAALFDRIPSPYPNEEFARYINGGALPPDLSLMAKARVRGDSYIMALLTGYRDPPANYPPLRDGLHYNPYFDGGAISMAKALMDGIVDYEDGTPATESQMAKDVSVFLRWCAEPEHNERKLAGMRALLFAIPLILITGYQKRFMWHNLKTRRITYPKGVGMYY